MLLKERNRAIIVKALSGQMPYLEDSKEDWDAAQEALKTLQEPAKIKKNDRVPFAVTFEQLQELPWYWGDENGQEYTHLLKPGYSESEDTHDKKYFGTSENGKRIISVNANYVGMTYVKIMEDGGTRTVFNGHVRSFEELKLVNYLVI